MARTRASIKQEPNEDRDTTSTDNATNTDMPSQEFMGPSSGSTVRNSDVEMGNASNHQATSMQDDQPVHSGIQDDSSLPDSTSPLFGERSKQLIQTIKNLSALNIDNTLPSLPKFVVVGDQSHGKSSLIEAIAEINLPRSEGTTTRCPFQIITSGSNSGWSCKVSLIVRYDYSPGTRNGAYPHWTDTGSQTTTELGTIRDPTGLEDALRKAQFAILNPGNDPLEIFRTVNLNSATSGLSFSPNIVSLEVTKPGLHELALYDLPGAINVAQSESEQHIVPFVERLLKNYLKDSKALILLAASLTSDIDTSTAYKFVYQSKATGRATGILTKPDLLIAQSPQNVFKILNGSIFQLKDGWFVTRQLSQQELDDGNVSHAEARLMEQQFFETKQPWCTALADFKHRFGVRNLQEALSHKLMEHILNDLPEINARVEARLQEVVGRLEAFPEEVKAPLMTILMEIENIRSAVSEHLRRDSEKDKTFRPNYTNALRDLQKGLRNARPHVVLSTPGAKPPSIDISDDEDESPPLQSTPTQTPSKARKGNNGRPVETPTRHRDVSLPHRTPRVKQEEGQASNTSTRVSFRLDEIKIMYESGSNSGIPGQQNPRVTETLILKSFGCWPDVINAALASVNEATELMLVTAINTTLANRRQTQLFHHTTKIVQQTFSELMEEQSNLVRKLLKCEMHKPITYAMDTLNQTKKAFETELEEKRQGIRVSEYFDKMESQGYKVSKDDRVKKVASVTQQLGDDKFAREVKVMGTVLAYYDIAAARLMDSFATTMEHEVLYALETKMREALLEGLQCTDPEHCAYLLAEDPAREAERQSLLVEKQKLTKALEELQGLHFVE